MPSPLHGQVAVSGSAQPMSATPVNVVAFSIKAPISNSNAAYVGNSGVTSSNGYQLDPGDTVEYELNSQNGEPSYQIRPSDFYVVGTSGDKVSWLASPAI